MVQLVYSLIVILVVLLPMAAFAKIVRIGTVTDGPTRDRLLLDAIHDETVSLLSDEFQVSFPSQHQLQGKWTKASVKSALNKLLAAKDVDLIITMGLLSCHEACQRRRLTKPVFAPTIVEGTMPDIPRRKGTSGVKNLSYLDSFSSFQRDVQIFRQITPFDELVVLVDGALWDGIPGINRLAERTERNLGISILTIPIERKMKRPLAVLPKDVQAVFVSPLQQLSLAQYKRLIEALIAKKLPSFSWGGKSDVQLGMLASNSRVQDNSRIARRIALNIQRVLLGEDAGTLKTAFPGEEQLTINMQTARQIGVYPPWSVISDANLVNEERQSLRQLSLRSVVKRAVKENLRLIAKEEEVSSAYEALRVARSRVLPKLNFSMTQSLIDDDRASASLGSQYERTLKSGLVLSQLIYSDKARANIRIENELHRSREAQLEQVRLDIIYDAVAAYLRVLQTRVSEKIQKSNLRLTRSNLDRAKVRVSIGIASRSELFRWESEIANAKKRVFEVQAKRRQAMVLLNQVLNKPLEEQFLLKKVDLKTQGLFFSDAPFQKFIRDPWSLEVLGEYIVKRAMIDAPEIAIVKQSIKAQERLCRTLRRAWRSPTVAFQGEISERLSQEGEGDPRDVFGATPLGAALPRVDNRDWSVGLSVSLPLSTGGERGAKSRQANRELARMKVLLDLTKLQVEGAVRQAFLATRSSYPAIELTKAAALAASKNLELVADAYGRGVVSIIDLLDAQNASLVSEQAASNAIFAFLLDVLRVQRAAGTYNFIKSKSELASWRKELEAFYARAKR